MTPAIILKTAFGRARRQRVAKAIEVAARDLSMSRQALPGNQTDLPIPALSITPFKGKWMIDFGTTLTGWPRLRLDGLKPGQEVVMDYADLLDPKLMYMHNADGVQTFNQRDVYVAGNGSTGVFQSKFNQHGFRYVIVGGLDKAPDAGGRPGDDGPNPFTAGGRVPLLK